MGKATSTNRIVNGLRFVMTCSACPEQYDVFRGEEKVGYVRIRHGTLTVDYPECRGENLICAEVNGDGEFASEEERTNWLFNAAEAIIARIDQ
jgi:hypothetical protein